MELIKVNGIHGPKWAGIGPDWKISTNLGPDQNQKLEIQDRLGPGPNTGGPWIPYLAPG